MTPHTLFFCLSIFAFLQVSHSVPSSPCPRNGTFLPWMQGRMRANFSDGTYAFANFTATHGNVLFEPSKQRGTLTMRAPLEGPTKEGAYVWHECLLFEGSTTPALRCSLIVRDVNISSVGGYIEHIHADPNLIPVCPTSIYQKGLVIERIYP
eukprot:PhF_6_TR17403/c0_g1_i1/m.26642